MMGNIDAPTAWWLTQGMARVIGVSLPNAVIEGWLTRRDLATLLDRGLICGKSEHCMRWLAVTALSDTLPAYCDNKAEIEALTPSA